MELLQLVQSVAIAGTLVVVLVAWRLCLELRVVEMLPAEAEEAPLR